MFAFSPDTEKETGIITYIDEVKNLESNKTNLGYREVRLIGVHDKEKLKQRLEEAAKVYENHGFIHFLDKNNSILTSTFISNIRIIKSVKSNLIISGHGWFRPKEFHKAWQMFMNNEITGKNTWKKFGKDELQDWLVFAECIRRLQAGRENLVISIDGDSFRNIDGFYCALGEEVNGIAGYFGRQLPALHDCLCGDFGVKPISEITWYHHQRSKKLLKINFSGLIKLFGEAGVNVILK